MEINQKAKKMCDFYHSEAEEQRRMREEGEKLLAAARHELNLLEREVNEMRAREEGESQGREGSKISTATQTSQLSQESQEDHDCQRTRVRNELIKELKIKEDRLEKELEKSEKALERSEEEKMIEEEVANIRKAEVDRATLTIDQLRAAMNATCEELNKERLTTTNQEAEISNLAKKLRLLNKQYWHFCLPALSFGIEYQQDKFN